MFEQRRLVGGDPVFGPVGGADPRELATRAARMEAHRLTQPAATAEDAGFWGRFFVERRRWWYADRSDQALRAEEDALGRWREEALARLGPLRELAALGNLTAVDRTTAAEREIALVVAVLAAYPREEARDRLGRREAKRLAAASPAGSTAGGVTAAQLAARFPERVRRGPGQPHWTACCPFHEGDRHWHLYIYEDSSMSHCFSCLAHRPAADVAARWAAETVG
jgi:hypothetical protein